MGRVGATRTPSTAPTFTPLLRDSGVAMHRQIAQQLKDLIAHGQWQPGTRIPTEPELSAQFGVSRITARQAVEHLVREGLVFRRQGKGTFVEGPRVRHDLLELRGIFDELVDQGLNPKTELLAFGTVRAPARVATRLSCVGERVIHWQRLYRLHGRPFGVSDVHLYSPDREVDRETAERLPTYEILKSVLSVQIDRADVAIRYEAGKAGICRAMDLPVGTPLMVLERVSYDTAGRAREHTLYYAEATSYEFAIRVRGPLRLVSNLNQSS
jgi:GntR family transcriptional regulator